MHKDYVEKILKYDMAFQIENYLKNSVQHEYLLVGLFSIRMLKMIPESSFALLHIA